LHLNILTLSHFKDYIVVSAFAFFFRASKEEGLQKNADKIMQLICLSLTGKTLDDMPFLKTGITPIQGTNCV
jgi:hypothetical protein